MATTNEALDFLQIALAGIEIAKPDRVRRMIDWYGKILAAGVNEDEDDELCEQLELFLVLLEKREEAHVAIGHPSYEGDITSPDPSYATPAK